MTLICLVENGKVVEFHGTVGISVMVMQIISSVLPNLAFEERDPEEWFKKKHSR